MKFVSFDSLAIKFVQSISFSLISSLFFLHLFQRHARSPAKKDKKKKKKIQNVGAIHESSET